MSSCAFFDQLWHLGEMIHPFFLRASVCHSGHQLPKEVRFKWQPCHLTWQEHLVRFQLGGRHCVVYHAVCMMWIQGVANCRLSQVRSARCILVQTSDDESQWTPGTSWVPWVVTCWKFKFSSQYMCLVHTTQFQCCRHHMEQGYPLRLPGEPQEIHSRHKDDLRRPQEEEWSCWSYSLPWGVYQGITHLFISFLCELSFIDIFTTSFSRYFQEGQKERASAEFSHHHCLYAEHLTMFFHVWVLIIHVRMLIGTTVFHPVTVHCIINW